MNYSDARSIGKEFAHPTAAIAAAIHVPLDEAVYSDTDPLFASLGTSVAVCLIDRNYGALCIRVIILPSMAHGHRQDAMLAADAAMEQLYNTMLSRVGSAEGLAAKIFGGAQGTADSPLDGGNNTAFVRNWLNLRKIPIIADDTGGPCPREIVALPADGRVYRRRAIRAQTRFPSEIEVFERTTPKESRVELF
jgi:chemotaxis receptor (MCP) glutamine deamidase CheD